MSLRIAAALAVSLVSTAAHADLMTFGKGHRIGKVQGVTPTKAQRSGFQKFKLDNGYFGAIYIDTSGEHWFYTRNFHDLRTAKAAALKGCQVMAEGDACSLYAVSLPKGMPLSTTSATGLSEPGYDVMTKRLPKEHVDGRHSAMAISGASDIGLSWSWPNDAEARAAAIAYCEKQVAGSLARLNIEGRKWAKSQGLTKCRVVKTLAP